MATRPADVIEVEFEGGTIDAFQKLELTADLHDAATASLDFGDDLSWATLESVVRPGRSAKVWCNGRLQFTGRVEVNDVPQTLDGSSVQVILRTKLSDARYRSAEPSVRFTDVSLRDFLLALFAPLGYTAADFRFAAYADRNLATGKATGRKDPVDLAPVKYDQLKVQPPETIIECATRILKRHHVLLWDGADGKIVVGQPDDTQDPLYAFASRRGAASVDTNILTVKRVRDWSEAPSEVWVFGATVGKDITKAPFRGVAVDLDLMAEAARSGHFDRKVLIPSDGAKTPAQADAQAARERSARTHAKDAWEVAVDGWSFWHGSVLIPYCPDTVATVEVDDIAAGVSGRYIVNRVARTFDAENHANSTLTLVAPSVYDL